MSRRLFLAIDPDEPTRSRLGTLATNLRRRIERRGGPRVTWVAPDRMHVTVHFLGEVEEDRAEAIIAAMAPPIDVAAFTLTIDRLGAFPDLGRPRVVWACGPADPAIREVHRRMGERLAACGCVLDARPFSPHVTLGRMRERGALPALSAVDPPIRFRVARLTLYESQLSSEGPHYTPVAFTALAETSG